MQAHIKAFLCYIFKILKKMYWEVEKDTYPIIQSFHVIVTIHSISLHTKMRIF